MEIGEIADLVVPFAIMYSAWLHVKVSKIEKDLAVNDALDRVRTESIEQLIKKIDSLIENGKDGRI